MDQEKRVFLVGFMGSGKTTIGKLLAKKLKIPFFDIDMEIELREGLTIPQIFSLKGESYFRQLEFEILKNIVSQNKEFVIATGGGLGANPEAMNYMKKQGLVVWLDLDFKKFKKRTYKDKNRPLLKLKEKELFALFQKRKEIYKKAHFRVESQYSPEETVKKILEVL
jgi:shikimate kinase